MTVRLVVTATGGVAFSGSGYGPEGAVQCERGRPIDDALRPKLACALTIATANNATLQEHEGRWWVHGDPTEAALIVAARKAGLKGDVLDARFTRRAELPFSSERRLMSTIDVDAERSTVRGSVTSRPLKPHGASSPPRFEPCEMHHYVAIARRSDPRKPPRFSGVGARKRTNTGSD
jgi:magnesium-transporting ATPase (P-type)